MIRRPPRSTLDRSSAASDVYKRQVWNGVKVDCGININGFRSEETEENINEEISDNFTIFPNPATILINFDIHNDTNQNYRIKILDMLGKEIYAQPEVTNSIDISSLTLSLIHI